MKTHRMRCVAVLLVAGSLAADSPEAVSAPWSAKKSRDTQSAGRDATDAASRESDDEFLVKLNFANAPWRKVLNAVAEQSGSTLVLHDPPPGRFSRRDRTRYSRTEAIRILNRELEPEGYRILDKDGFLIVIELHSLRARYRRRELPQEPDDASVTNLKSEPTGRFAKYENKTHTIASRKKPSQAESSEREAGNQRGPIRRVAHVDETQSGMNRLYQGEFEQPESIIIRPRSKRATELARTIYSSLKAQAELIPRGPSGLPAFRVYRSKAPANDRARPEQHPLASPASITGTLFTVEIDANRDELHISAPPSLSRELVSLIRQLDSSRDKPSNTIRLVTSSQDARQMARKIEPALNRLVAQREPRVALNQEPRRTAEEEPAANASEAAASDAASMIDGLKGDVEIQTLPGSGILILRGNEKDLEAVRKLIEEIDELSKAAAIEVRVLNLKHVNSAAFAGLLNSVYEQMGIQKAEETEQSRSVNIIPVVKPNAILILAPAGDMDSILKLADELDQPVDPQNELQVFHLRYAVAPQVVSMLESFYAADRPGLSPRIYVVADVRTNSVVVQARPNDLLEVALLIRKIDRDESKSVNRMRMFPLKNAIADEVAEVINQTFQAALNPPTAVGQTGVPTGNQGQAPGQGSQQLQQVKSVVLEFLSTEGAARQMVRSGILADIRVTSEPRTNNLIVTAPEQSMKLMAALIAQLDQPSATVSDIKIFQLKNADATSTAELLESLFSPQNQQDQRGLSVAGAEDFSSNLVPLRFSVDVRTNSVIAVGGPDALVVVNAILLTLDASDIRQRQTTVVRLQNSDATLVAESLNQFLESQRALLEFDPEAVSTVEFLEREIIAVPEVQTNSLIISATPRYYEEILEIVRRLDEAPRQVVIQALLVEVVLDNIDEFGIELGLQDSMFFNRSITTPDDITTVTDTFTNASGITTTSERIISQATTPGFLFNDTSGPLGNNSSANPTSLATQGLSDLNLGRLNSELGFGGLVLSASSSSISVLLRALSEQRTVRVLSRPMIRTLDNQPAEVHVGQQVPVVDGVQVTQFTANPNIRQEQVGLILSVKPRITPDGRIVMEVSARKSRVSDESVPIFFDATSDTTIEAAIIDITSAQASVSVENGQTIVLGGMITQNDETLERKVPWLGDLPVLGRAFRFDSTRTLRTELLIFLTPRIVSNDVDNELIKQVESERLHYIVEEAEAMHGPLFATPPECQGADCLRQQLPREEQIPVPPEPLDVPNDGPVPTTRMPRFEFDGPRLDRGNDSTMNGDHHNSTTVGYQQLAPSSPQTQLRLEPRKQRRRPATLFPFRRNSQRDDR